MANSRHTCRPYCAARSQSSPKRSSVRPSSGSALITSTYFASRRAPASRKPSGIPIGVSGSKRRNSTSSTDTPVTSSRRSDSRRSGVSPSMSYGGTPTLGVAVSRIPIVRKPAAAAPVTSSGGLASRTVRCASETSRGGEAVTPSVLRERELGEELLVLGLVVDLHRREEADHPVVEGDRDDEVGEPLVVQLVPQRRESPVRDREAGRHLARGPKHDLRQRLQLRRPAGGLRGKRSDVVVGHAEVAADLDVMRVFVHRLREVADLQDRELAEPRIEPALVADELAEPVERARAVRAVHHRAEEVDVPRQQVLVLGGKVGLVQIG